MASDHNSRRGQSNRPLNVRNIFGPGINCNGAVIVAIAPSEAVYSNWRDALCRAVSAAGAALPPYANRSLTTTMARRIGSFISPAEYSSGRSKGDMEPWQYLSPVETSFTLQRRTLTLCDKSFMHSSSFVLGRVCSFSDLLLV